MQTVTATASPAAAPRAMSDTKSAPSVYHGYQIIRRNGAVVSFEPNKIAVALMKAFLAEIGRASCRERV